MEDNNTLLDEQHGFKTKRGTDTAITTIYETISHHTANKDQCYVILRDVSKAFDSVAQRPKIQNNTSHTLRHNNQIP